MLRRSIYVLYLAACLAFPSVAQASEQSAVDDYFSPWAGPKGLNTLRHLASCVAERHPGAAQALVRSVGLDLVLRSRSEELIDNKCIKNFWFRSSRTRIEPVVYTPLLAEELITSAYTRAQLPSIADVAPLDHPALPDVDIETVHPRYRDTFSVDHSLVMLARVTECVAREAPGKVFQLAASEPGSSDESAVMSSLAAAKSKCLAGDLSVTYPAFAWRGALVMNLYRLVDAARPVTYPEAPENA